VVEESSEIASVIVSSIYRKSTNKSVFVPRKLSLSKISEEESENAVDGEREDEEQLNIVTKEGNDNFVSDNQKMADKVALNIRFIPEITENNKPTLM
jgi:hypothetical protein